MENEFEKDMYEGLMKIVEISSYMLKCLKIEAGRDFAEPKKEDDVVIVETQQNMLIDSDIKGVDYMKKNIRKRADGRWEGRKYVDGKRISVYAPTQKECLQKLKNYKKPVVKKPEPNLLSVAAYANKWLELYKKQEVKGSTFKLYETLVRNHIAKLNRSINRYTTDDLQEFVNSLSNTRVRELVTLTLKQIFQKAYETKVIKYNPAVFVRKGHIERKHVENFTLEEQKKILDNLKNDKISWHILGFLMTGARLSELHSIKKENIKRGYLLIEGTKTASSSKRWIKISPRFEKLLLEHDDPLFSYSPKRLQKYFKAFMNEIGVEGNVHRLRHTFNTNLYYLGATDLERKEFMGHASIIVTNDIYTHLDKTVTKEDVINLYKDLYPTF